MINILFCLIFISFIGLGFVYGVDYSGIHRTFMLLNSTLIHSSVATANDEINNPYFEQNILENVCIDFLGKNLKKYTNDFEIGFYYFNPTSNDYCYQYCEGVRISLNAKMAFNVTYSNAFIYKIKVS